MSETPTIHRGLEGIYVDQTSIAHIDGEKGTLTYRERSIEKLVEMDFLDVVWLVLFGDLPKDAEKHSMELLFSEHSCLTADETYILRRVPSTTHPMKVLQGVVPLLHLNNPSSRSLKIDKEAQKGLILAAKIPAILSAFHLIRSGKDVVTEITGLSFHESFLYRFNGRLPGKEEVDTLNTTQILQMEHGFNASTFAARVTASTLAPIECAVSSAIGTLFGKLHGGADQAALEMAMELGSPAKAENFVLEMLKTKQKIMGMGHRVYRVVDPRAKILKPLARQLCEDTPFMDLYLTLEKIEETMEVEMQKKGKRIKANVEFYKGPVFYALGIPPEYFTSLFAMARVFGYLAHILESRKNNRIIRPKGFYTPQAS